MKSPTFYGQLAAARYRQDDRLSLPTAPHVDAIEQAAFDEHELVKLVYLLSALKRRKLVAPFVQHLNETGRTPGWRSRVAELARAANRRDLVVSIAKKANREGTDLGASGYPTLGADLLPGLERPLLLALIRQESAFNDRAVSHAGARGLMQLMPRTARRVAKTIRKPYVPRRLTEDPAYNLDLGQAYLRGLLRESRSSAALMCSRSPPTMPGPDRQAFVQDITEDVGRFRERHRPALDLACHPAMDPDTVGDNLAADLCRFTDHQNIGVDISFNGSVNLNFAIAQQISNDLEVGAQQRRRRGGFRHNRLSDLVFLATLCKHTFPP